MADIKLRQYSASICDIFENLLDKHDIIIPDEDREGMNRKVNYMEWNIVT